MSRLNLRKENGGFGRVVEAQYGVGYSDAKAALMAWSTYNFLVNLSVADEPITAMNYKVLYATKGHGYLTGDKIPQEILRLPDELPVAVKSYKINVRELARLTGKKYLVDTWHNTDLIPSLVALGLIESKYPVGIEVDIPSHARPTGTGAYWFEY